MIKKTNFYFRFLTRFEQLIMVLGIAHQAAAMSQAKIRLTNVSPIEEKQEDLQGDSRPDDIFPIRMASVVRVSKLPVIEQTSNIAVNVYKKVKVSPLTVNFHIILRVDSDKD